MIKFEVIYNLITIEQICDTGKCLVLFQSIALKKEMKKQGIANELINRKNHTEESNLNKLKLLKENVGKSLFIVVLYNYIAPATRKKPV